MPIGQSSWHVRHVHHWEAAPAAMLPHQTVHISIAARRYSARALLSPAVLSPADRGWSSCDRWPPRPAAPPPAWWSRPAPSPDWWRHWPDGAPPPPSHPAAHPPVDHGTLWCGHCGVDTVVWYSVDTTLWREHCGRYIRRSALLTLASLTQTV